MSGDDATVGRLGRLLPEVDHAVETVATLAYEIGSAADERGHEVTEEGDRLTYAPDPAAAADAVYVRAYRRAFEFASLSGWVRLHAVTVDIEGRRHLLVGPSGAGKTSLALALSAVGHHVQGDESVLVRDGRSFAVARGFHVKRAAQQLVPRFAASVRDGLWIGDVSVVDPRSLNDDWRIDIAPVDVVVFLSDQGDGRARLTTAPPHKALEALAHAAFVVTGSKSALLAVLVSISAGARCRTLTRGPLDAMCAVLVDGAQ